MNSLNVGIIGCGNISGIYLQNIPAYRGLTLRACADMRPEVAQAQASRHGIEAMSVDQLLARDDIDLVVNLTVPAAHFGVSLAALSAGKHVFSEKPLAVDFEQGRRLVDEAEARGLHLGCAPDTFLGAGGRLARKLVDDGAVGRILSGTAFLMSHGMEHWHPDPEFFFKPGGGPILDMAPVLSRAPSSTWSARCKRVFAMSSIGFPERIVTAESPRKGERITGRDADPRDGAARIRLGRAGDLLHELGRVEAQPSGHRALRHGRVAARARSELLRRPCGDHRARRRLARRRFERDAARSSQLALAQLGARMLRRAPITGRSASPILPAPSCTARRIAPAGGSALHVLEVMHSILEGAATGQPMAITTTLSARRSWRMRTPPGLWKGLPQTASAA